MGRVCQEPGQPSTWYFPELSLFFFHAQFILLQKREMRPFVNNKYKNLEMARRVLASTKSLELKKKKERKPALGYAHAQGVGWGLSPACVCLAWQVFLGAPAQPYA